MKFAFLVVFLQLMTSYEDNARIFHILISQCKIQLTNPNNTKILNLFLNLKDFCQKFKSLSISISQHFCSLSCTHID